MSSIYTSINEKIQNQQKKENTLRELGFEKPKLIRSTNEYPPASPKINLFYEKEVLVDKLK
jgi:hypothetical protein